MRALERNKKEFYYSLYVGKEDVRDESGNLTGEKKILFGKPEIGFANISTAQGYTETLQFGDNLAYDKVILLDFSFKHLLSINEHTVLWVDSKPELTEDGTLKLDDNGNELTPHDYVVRRKAVSLNNITLAISKVEVS